jgi:competence protein ComEC
LKVEAGSSKIECNPNGISKGGKMKKFKYFAAALVAVGIIVAIGYQFIPARPTELSPLPLFRVTYLDVGQGDSAVVQSDSSNLLIDAGTNATANSLVKEFKNMGIGKFDVVVGTHPQEDHIGGLDTVIRQFDIGKIYMPKVSATSRTFEDVLRAIQGKGLTVSTPVAGSSFNLGSAGCSILAPNSQSYENVDNYSIVIRVGFGANSFLFTGDAQVDSEKEMLVRGYILKSDVLKVGHHGSWTSTSPDFLKSVSPQFAVISVGKDNSYGHPHRETLEKLSEGGIKVYRTDLNGTVTFTSDGSNLAVQTEK